MSLQSRHWHVLDEGRLRPDTVEEFDVLVVSILSEKRASAVSFYVGAVAGTNFASFRRF